MSRQPGAAITQTHGGMRRGETEREFAERCRANILAYFLKEGAPLPEVRITEVESDHHALRSNLVNGWPPV